MTIYRSIGRRARFAVSLANTALLAAALLTGVATDAFAAGSISGRVTSSTTTLGLANTVVKFYDMTGNDEGNLPAASATTDALGNYTANLTAGSYAVITQDIHGYINQIYNSVPCSATCNGATLTPVVVTNGAVTGIDFVLDPGGRISGTVTSSVTTLPIAGVRVNFTDAAGQFMFTGGLTDASGNYVTDGGTATGSVFAITTNTQGYQDELYNGFLCGSNCNVTTGTAISVTNPGGATGINFVLEPGGRITGTVTDANSNPLANVEIDIEVSTGQIISTTVTDGSGNYSTAGLPTGNYYAFTRNNLGLVDQLYNNVTCVRGNCDPTTGTAISVTVGATASGKNFVLSPGGRVTGTVTAAAGGAPVPNAFVSFVTVSTTPGPTFGLITFLGGANTQASGQYSVVLPPGTVFAVVNNVPGFANQLYNGLGCAGTTTGNFVCNPAGGTPINVTAGATIGNVNFALQASGSISGTVTNAAGGAPLSNINVQVFSSAGVNQGSFLTGASGIYTFTGLAVGSYYVRTNTAGPFISQLYNGVVCIGCAVTASGGTLVPVAANATTSGINFPLTTGGRISGTITNAVGGTPIQGVSVQIFGPTGLPMGTTATNASGVYTSPGLPAGSYFVRTAVSAGQNFIDQLWNNLPCVPCTVTTGSPVMVTGTATTSGINLSLSPGGSISGTVTDAGAGGAAVASMPVIVFDFTGVNLKNTTTDASGTFTVAGLPTGNYFVLANPNAATQNYATQLYSGFASIGLPTTGTPVAVTVGATHTGVNFALVSGGSLSGTVTDAGTSGPLAGVQIAVYSPAGRVLKNVATNTLGAFTVTGLPAGSYYVSTRVGVSTPFYVDELYNNVPCLGCVSVAFPNVVLPCMPSCVPTVTTGTPVVIANGMTLNGVNFALTAGAGSIAGAVTDAVTLIGLLNVQVLVYNASGTVVTSATTAANTGAFTVNGLAPGTYYARTVVSPATPHYTDVAFDNVACAPCDVTTTSPITVTANTITSGIDFALASGGSIAGAVTDLATNPLASVGVQLFDAAGNLVKATFSGSTGLYELDGLPAGLYYARTAVPVGSIYVDELYNGIRCTSCAVTNGQPIAVTNGTTQGAVNFALPARVISNLAGNFGGGGKADLVVFRPSNGTWYISDPSTGAQTGVQWGNASDIPVPGDYDGDGKSDIAVFRPSNGTWYIVYSSTGTTAGFQWGNGTDVPVPGDYYGDRKTDLAVFRPSNGTWYIWEPSTGAMTGVQWGNGADIPVPGDYDGDGKTDIAVFRLSNGTWYIVYSSTGTTAGFQWGNGTDVPVPGHYFGDRKTDLAVFRPSNGTWYIWEPSTGAMTGVQWGNGADIPVPADYDGDGKTDIAVFRPSNGTWFIVYSSTGMTAAFQWGNGTDVP